MVTTQDDRENLAGKYSYTQQATKNRHRPHRGQNTRAYLCGAEDNNKKTGLPTGYFAYPVPYTDDIHQGSVTMLCYRANRAPSPSPSVFPPPLSDQIDKQAKEQKNGARILTQREALLKYLGGLVQLL